MTETNLDSELRNAVRDIADDYQTSEQHHPEHVLIPLAKFEQLRILAEKLKYKL